MNTQNLTILLSTTFLVLGVLPAQAGAPDMAFAGQGFEHLAGGNDVCAVAVQADGRIVYAGSAATSPNWSWVLGRCLDNGAPDPSFGNSGLVVVPGGFGTGQATDLAIDPQGRIVVTGKDIVPGTNRASFTVRRFLADGTPDSSFGVGGLAAAAIDYEAFSITLGLVPAGGPSGYAIVVGGYSKARNSGYHFALARFTDGGALDTANFGDWTSRKHTSRKGYVLDDTYNNASLLPRSRMAIAPNGNITMVGYLVSVVDSDFLIASYLPDGSSNTAFGSGGHVLDSVAPGMGSRQPRGCVAQADGMVIVVGRGRNPGQGNIGTVLLRYDTNGARDAGFGVNGLAQTGIAFENQPAHNVEIDGNGRVTVATSAVMGAETQITSFRFLANGQPDPGYGTAGQGAVFGALPSSGDQSVVWKTATDGLGRTVLCGYGFSNGNAQQLLGRIQQ
ncbi:MAG: hypothetical protein H6838_03020 [Planctomycetes bacterium]|nr:hypothetical protein [Planctomycetota bacterium]